MSGIRTSAPKLQRLADAIAQRVGIQRYTVWFSHSTKLDLKQDGLEIAVPNDFISDWIGSHYGRLIQDAANEVLGAPLPLKFSVVPQLFDECGNVGEPQIDDVTVEPRNRFAVNGHGEAEDRVAAAIDRYAAAEAGANGHAGATAVQARPATSQATTSQVNGKNGDRMGTGRRNGLDRNLSSRTSRSGRHMVIGNGSAEVVPPSIHSDDPSRLRHALDSFVVGASNQLAFNAAGYVAEHPGAQYNPLFIHGASGLGKTHLVQGLCRKFAAEHPTKNWLYISGEEFTNQFVLALRNNTADNFRRRLRDLDLLAIDDVHFLAGKKATQEEFLHTFNAIEAMGRQVVMASDAHPKLIEEFGESLINRFMSGMVVRVDPPNFQTRCDIMRSLADRTGCSIPDDVIIWVARRITSNIRELEGSITRLIAHSRTSGKMINVELAQEALADLDRTNVQPLQPDAILRAVCQYFSLEMRQLMSGRRQRTISIARSVAMFLIRRTARLSFPEIGARLGRRNHSTVISACRRIERALQRNEMLAWTSSVGQRSEEADELLQRLEDLARNLTA